jgi:hypothetical protein
MRCTPRKRMIVDARLQGALILRVVAYWFLSLVAVGLMLITWDIAQGLQGPYIDPARSNQLWYTALTITLASVLLLPVLLADTVLFSNRFAGPVFRFRKELRALTAGEKVEPLRFRKKDDWAGLDAEFNALVEYVERLKHEHRSAAGAAPSQPQREPDRPVACPSGNPTTLVDTPSEGAYVENLQVIS